MKNEIKIKSTSFEINKLITTTQLYSKIKLSISARLVLRCIVDFWNFKIGCAYPTQQTICKCTGLSEVAVISAIKELARNDLIEKEKRHKRFYYYFTLKLLRYLELTPKIIYVNTLKNLSNIPKSALDKNILKDIENTSFSQTFKDEDSDQLEEDEEEELTDEERGLAFAKATVKHLSHIPAFAKKVKELKEKYNL